MGMFGKINEARYSEGGIYVLPGVFRFEIQKCKSGHTRAQVPFFVAELAVLESNNPERPVGSSCSYMVTLDKEPALGNIRHFCAVACGSDIEEVGEAEVEAIVAENNPLAGVKIRCSAVNITTKKGQPFTKCKFLPDSVGAQAAAAAAA
jgi:hypothetical protein